MRQKQQSDKSKARNNAKRPNAVWKKDYNPANLEAPLFTKGQKTRLGFKNLIQKIEEGYVDPIDQNGDVITTKNTKTK